MITDIFSRRYPNLDLQNLSNAFFVQLFNIYNDPHTGIRKLSWRKSKIILIQPMLMSIFELLLKRRISYATNSGMKI